MSLGGGGGDDKNIVVLGRRVRRIQGGVELEVDERQGRLSREQSRIVPWVHRRGLVGCPVRAQADEDGSDEKLSKGESSKYQAMAAWANYLGVGQANLQFAVKEACRDGSIERGRP